MALIGPFKDRGNKWYCHFEKSCKRRQQRKRALQANVITRSNKIDKLIESMDNWDFDTLISWVKDHRRKLLEKASNKIINFEYNLEVRDKKITRI